jgi:tetratricopeptide (TPR) repeat protein
MTESGSGWEYKVKKPDLEVSSSEIIFGIDADFDEHVGSLQEACDVKDLDTIKQLLSNNKFIENLVIRKGINKELLILLEKAVNALVQQEIGKSVGEISDSKELERVIQSGKLPPFAVAELAGAFYHLKRYDESEKLVGLITNAQNIIIDLVSQANAYNTLGCIYLREGEVEASLDAHKAGLDLLPKKKDGTLNESWQRSKLLYGTVIDMFDRLNTGTPVNQSKKDKDRREKLESVRDNLFKRQRERNDMGDMYNIGRVDLDVAKVFQALGKKDDAIFYAERAKESMSQVGYWSGAEQAGELLRELNQKR